jgi:hypothetical protein
MATKSIRNIRLTDNLTMSECKDGYWLYDYTKGMNLSMRAKTQEDAFVEAISYYQKRLEKVEIKLNKQTKEIDKFISSISIEE